MARLRITGAALYAGILLGMLALVVFLNALHPLSSIYQDIGRHLTFGKIIWEEFSVPKTNLVSYTAPDFPFINHHWLSEVFLYLGERVVGLSGLIVAKAFTFLAAFALAFLAAFRRSLLIPAIGTGFLALLIMAGRTDVRPEIFSYLFLSWFLFVLYRLKPYNLQTTTYKLLWSLPIVQLLWVNTHIYFFMGPFLFTAFAFGELAKRNFQFSVFNFQNWRVRHWKFIENSKLEIVHSRRIILLGIAMATATLMNPWLWEGAFYPLTLWGNYGYSIVENQSYFFLRSFGYPIGSFLVLLLGAGVTTVSFIINRKHIRQNVMGAMLALATFILALVMIRNYPLFGLVMMPVVMKNLAEAGIRWEQYGRVLVAALLGLALVSVVQGQFAAYVAPGGHAFGVRVPVGHQQAVDSFREQGLRGPIFNNFDIGSYLVWKLPEEPVFIDGRPEAYPAEFIRDVYIAMQEQPEVWQEQVDRYGINTVFWYVRDITPWSQAFLARIRKDPAWPRVYADETIEIYTRKENDNY